MCFGGGGSVQSGPQMEVRTVTEPSTGVTTDVMVETGIPDAYILRGATTVAQYQNLAAQDASDKQIQAQREIAKQAADLNERQFNIQQEQFRQQQQQVEQQANYQSEYDAGRAQALGEGQQQVQNAFARFTPEYFNQYARDYMTKVQDEVARQRAEADRNLAFQMARQGITRSQALATEQGRLEETQGRTLADQTTQAQNAAANLQSSTFASRQNLLNQVAQAQNIGSPIAGRTIQDVNSALQTQRNAISGIASTAGDVAAQTVAVPTVTPLGNLFAGIGAGAANFVGGAQAGDVLGRFNAGLAGTDPKGGSTTTRTI